MLVLMKSVHTELNGIKYIMQTIVDIGYGNQHRNAQNSSDKNLENKCYQPSGST